ncbi:MAG: cellulase [Akkermansiaceae bacterium]|nr:cellulase [Verrucomicrobiales bacterium]
MLQAGVLPPASTNSSVSIVVDALQNRHPINPLIYGVAFASSNELVSLNTPLNRSGGNSETRYNWQLNAHNRAADWYFQSLENESDIPGAAADAHVANSRAASAEAMVTVPMIGWVARLGANRARLSSYSIAKYGPQTGSDWQWFPDAGNGIGTNTTTHTSWLITTNNPNDANVLTDSTFQQNWIRHLTNQWGTSTNGGVRFYCMDNEHTLWNSTHRDVHPVGTTMQEIRDKFFDYAAKVKEVDPNALIVAPEEWGWPGYFYSGYDQQWSGANNNYNPAQYPDRGTNGGWDYMPWFLDQARRQATNTNQRLLDYFTLHIYPQGGEFGNDTSTAMQLRRNRSTRCLWDTNYLDETWINSVVKLIPRMKGWVTNYYPGTKIGITEYNWGAEDHINGATAQADVYGIFGREGIDLATRWTTPAASTPTFKAMQMYCNYDGNGSSFGDTSISAGGPNPNDLSTFAAVRSSDAALTVMVINKQLGSNQPVNITLNNFKPAGAVQVWRLTSANAITRQSDLSVSNGSLSNTLPAQSITLFVIPGDAKPSLRLVGLGAGNSFDFWVDGQAGQRYAVQSSSNLLDWTSIQTNTLTTNSLWITLPSIDDPERFYRAKWLP